MGHGGRDDARELRRHDLPQPHGAGLCGAGSGRLTMTRLRTLLVATLVIGAGAPARAQPPAEATSPEEAQTPPEEERADATDAPGEAGDDATAPVETEQAEDDAGQGMDDDHQGSDGADDPRDDGDAGEQQGEDTGEQGGGADDPRDDGDAGEPQGEDTGEPQGGGAGEPQGGGAGEPQGGGAGEPQGDGSQSDDDREEAPRNLAPLGWGVGLLGGAGARFSGPRTDGPAWFSGLELGFRGRLHHEDSHDIALFGGARALLYGLDDPRDPNERASYLGFGLAVAPVIQVHAIPSNLDFLVRPQLSVVASRETSVNPPLWLQGGVELGISGRLVDDWWLSARVGAEVWVPPTDGAATSLFGTLRIQLSQGVRPPGEEDAPVRVDEYFDRLSEGALSDVIAGAPEAECELAGTPDQWTSVEDLRCSDAMTAPLDPGRCATFVGVAHDGGADVDLRARAGPERFEIGDGQRALVSDLAADGWPVNVLCNFTDDPFEPTVELRRYQQRTAMTLRRYDREMWDQDSEPNIVHTRGAITADRPCVALHLADGDQRAILRLPHADGAPQELRMWSPRVAAVQAELRRDTVAWDPGVLDGVSARAWSERRFEARERSDGGYAHPFLEIASGVIGAPVVVCVEPAEPSQP
ncbi:MAG TPA: hypothetical protein RMH99_16620 [Sandaracinaceae bacterium LLY-WYZ-13_1]|nr:hypothetical protein [Sandaracinaceae bacterium LLY-WYZ-13_1]